MGAPLRAEVPASILIALRLTPDERKRYRRAARFNGVSLSNWIRTTLDASSKPRARRTT